MLTKNSIKERIHTFDEYLKLPLSSRQTPRGAYLTPYSMEWKEWPKFWQHIKQNYPIQYFFRETVRNFFGFEWYAVKQDWYYLKCLLWKKYNWLKLRNDPTWLSADSKIELALEKILIDFVEKERPFEVIDWEQNEESREAAEIIKDAYEFFTVTKPEMENQIDELLHEGYGKLTIDEILDQTATENQKAARAELTELEEELEEKHTSVLVKLIKIRGTLWT